MKKIFIITFSVLFTSIIFSGCFGLFHNQYHDSPPKDHPSRYHR